MSDDTFRALSAAYENLGRSMKHTPVPEIIKNEIEAAINIPSLQHIETRLITWGKPPTMDDEAVISFWVYGHQNGVSLRIYADMSMTLRFPDEPCAISWTAAEVTPEKIKAAVIDALRAVVSAAA